MLFSHLSFQLSKKAQKPLKSILFIDGSRTECEIKFFFATVGLNKALNLLTGLLSAVLYQLHSLLWLTGMRKLLQKGHLAKQCFSCEFFNIAIDQSR